jgi:hypothetical protein
MSLSFPPVPSHASQTSLPPPKHSLHLMDTTPLPLQMSHSNTPFSVVSFPVPLHSSHLAGIEPVPLHFVQLTSPSPLQVVQTKIENLNLTYPVSRLRRAMQSLLLNLPPIPPPTSQLENVSCLLHASTPRLLPLNMCAKCHPRR